VVALLFEGMVLKSKVDVAEAASRKLTVGRPNVMNRQRFLERVEQILDSKSFTNDGPFVRELEQSVCTLFAVKHCIAVANATLGLEITLSALNVTGEVIVPSFTFVATAHAIRRIGAEPVFCDISKLSYSLDVSMVEAAITERTTAIVAVNLYGGLADLERLADIANKYKLHLIYDSAHSLGTKWKGNWTGSLGDAEVFSLHGTKFINGFEGGLITTNNDELAKRCALLRNFCFTGYDQVSDIGTNAKLSEIHAAMALTNFECMDEIIAKNKTNYSWYKRYLPDQAKLLSFDEKIESNYQYVVVILPDAASRDAIQEHLLHNDIFVRKYFYPGIHQFECYRQEGLVLPVTEDIAARVLCFPTGQEITEEDVKHICVLMTQALESMRLIQSV